MNKIIIASVMIFFLIGCGEEGCKNLSWEASSSLSLKSSAGNKCENINDYYDIDIEEIISEIQKMKFILNDACKEENPETGEMEVVQCPEFIPETIEFEEVVSCSFSTPPDENTDCAPGPLNILFASNGFFEKMRWEFRAENPKYYPQWGPAIFQSENNETQMYASFSDGSLTAAELRFVWKESQNEMIVDLKYSVEIKE